MKTKTYRFGRNSFKAYHRTVGQGFEVGLYFNRKTLFVGNFIHKNEAARWWGYMNREIRMFTKKYWITDSAPIAWYGKFFANNLYTKYYGFLDKLFNKYNSTFHRAFNKDMKRYNRLKRNWHTHGHTKTMFKAA